MYRILKAIVEDAKELKIPTKEDIEIQAMILQIDK